MASNLFGPGKGALSTGNLLVAEGLLEKGVFEAYQKSFSAYEGGKLSFEAFSPILRDFNHALVGIMNQFIVWNQGRLEKVPCVQPFLKKGLSLLITRPEDRKPAEWVASFRWVLLAYKVDQFYAQYKPIRESLPKAIRQKWLDFLDKSMPDTPEYLFSEVSEMLEGLQRIRESREKGKQEESTRSSKNQQLQKDHPITGANGPLRIKASDLSAFAARFNTKVG